jgi:hypothetical protein
MVTRQAKSVSSILGVLADDDRVAAAPSVWDDPEEDAGERLRLFGAASPETGAPDGRATWRAAEAAAWPRLLAAAAALARLDERLLAWHEPARRAGVGRLALIQAADLAWADGAPVGPEHLALDAAQRTGRVGEDGPALARAAWAARRLAARAWRPHDLAPARGEADAGADAEADVGQGAAREHAPMRGIDPEAARAWADALASLRGLHPVTQACAAARLWRRLGVDDGTSMLRVEVAAMKIAGRAGRGGIAFAPTPKRRRLGGVEAADRLAGFAADVADGATAALARLQALQDWRARAEAAVADLSGRTPPRLVAALAERVALTTQDAMRACDASKAAVRRNLAVLADRGIAREISGQARFQVWTAAA